MATLRRCPTSVNDGQLEPARSFLLLLRVIDLVIECLRIKKKCGPRERNTVCRTCTDPSPEWQQHLIHNHNPCIASITEESSALNLVHCFF